MKNFKTLLIAAISFSFLIACKNDTSPPIHSRTESFTVACNQSITLQLSNGDNLVIDEKTFVCEGDNSFELIVNTVKSKKEMILSGLQTVDSDNQILESAGMIQIDFPENIKINNDNPVIYKAKSDYYDPNMKSYALDSETNKWTLTNNELEVEGIDEILLGESLYNTQCSQCHSKKLDQDMTGPALAHVTKFRSMDWLVEFTKNSQAMIAKGDILAINLWNKWKPTIITAYPNYESSEIVSIYKFIENESKIQNIPIDSTQYISQYDTLIVYPGNTNTVFETTSSRYLRDTSVANVVYFNKLMSRRWYNVDRYYSTTNNIETPVLNIKNTDEITYAFVAFENENSIISFTQSEDITMYHLLSSQGKDSINWPVESNIYIVAFSTNASNVLTKGKIKKMRFKEKNNYISLTLDDMDLNEFDKLISILDK